MGELKLIQLSRVVAGLGSTGSTPKVLIKGEWASGVDRSSHLCSYPIMTWQRHRSLELVHRPCFLGHFVDEYQGPLHRMRCQQSRLRQFFRSFDVRGGWRVARLKDVNHTSVDEH